MRSTWAVFRRELGALTEGATWWVTTILFVVALHAGFFFLGFPIGDRRLPPLWTGGVASLDALYAWLPLAMCVLAPALTMGLWAEERRAGTGELLLAQPVHVRNVVAGKFLAAWAVLAGVASVAILSAGLMVASVGPLDPGTLVGGLVGAALLSAACVAVGCLTSAWTQDQLVAFLGGFAILFTLWSAGLFVRVLPPTLAEAVWYASPALHFLEGGARGVLDARDVLYHGLIVLVGLDLNTAAVEARRWG